MIEEWRNITGTNGSYLVSNIGRIKSMPKRTGRGIGFLRPERILNGTNDCTDGYLVVGIKINGKTTPQRIHRLVAQEFIGTPPNDKYCVCHKDGTRTNNFVDNLYYGSPKDNCSDTVRHGRTPKGEKNPRGKLKREEVELIRKIRCNGYSCAFVGKMFKVKKVAVSRITRGISWGWHKERAV